MLPPNIDDLPPYPNPTDPPTLFNQKANTYVAAMVTFVNQLQSLIEWLSSNVGSSPISSIDDTTVNVTSSHIGVYLRLTNASAKSVVIANTSFPIGSTFNIRNVGAGNASLDNSIFSFSIPPGGSLLIPQNGTVSLIYLGDQSFDVIGQTVPA